MIIDCDTCTVRGTGCHGCVMTVLLGISGPEVALDESEERAFAVLADSGLVPPLRMTLLPAAGQ